MKINPGLCSTISYLFLLSSACILATGCGSTVCMVSKRHLQQFSSNSQPAVYITNPEMKREYEILRMSGIYQITTNSEASAKLTLRPIFHAPGCANPLMLSAITIGVIPGTLPGNYLFQYDLETGGSIDQRMHRLPVYIRFSIWEWIVPGRDEIKLLADSLAWSKSEKNTLLDRKL